MGIDSDEVSAVVTDNAANTVKAVDLAFGKKEYTLFCVHFEFGYKKSYTSVWNEMKSLLSL